MHLATGFAARLVDGLIETTLNQEVGALGIQSYAGKIGTVADAAKPGMELRQIKIGSQKAWNNDNRRTVAVWDSQAVIDGSCVEDQDFGSDESLSPKRSAMGLRIGLASGCAPSWRRTRVHFFRFGPQFRSGVANLRIWATKIAMLR